MSLMSTTHCLQVTVKQESNGSLSARTYARSTQRLLTQWVPRTRYLVNLCCGMSAMDENDEKVLFNYFTKDRAIIYQPTEPHSL